MLEKIYRYLIPDEKSGEWECGICHEGNPNIKNGACIHGTNILHPVHIDCALEWLKYSQYCAVCKTPLATVKSAKKIERYDPNRPIEQTREVYVWKPSADARSTAHRILDYVTSCIPWLVSALGIWAKNPYLTFVGATGSACNQISDLVTIHLQLDLDRAKLLQLTLLNNQPNNQLSAQQIADRPHHPEQIAYLSQSITRKKRQSLIHFTQLLIMSFVAIKNWRIWMRNPAN